MRSADRLFYCVVEPIAELWLRQLNTNAVSLAPLYAEGKPRAETYRAMESVLLNAVTSGLNVCAAFYGHPGVFVQSTHAVIATLRNRGYSARMLPGVSADACLVADLGVNPGDRGMQGFEATDFLYFRRRFDPTTPLVLWQIGVLGDGRGRAKGLPEPARLELLVDRLARSYPLEHRMIVYTAATFPTHAPLMRSVRLKSLSRTRVGPLAMLYVPPLQARALDTTMIRQFNSLNSSSNTGRAVRRSS
jgi:hypothetical protein